MEIEELNSSEFESIFQRPYFVYGKSAFKVLNSHKVEKVFFLAFKEGKYRLGLTFGLRNNTLYTPFSAPFGGFIYSNESIKINHLDDALLKLSTWAFAANYDSIYFTLPPLIYNETFIAKQMNSLFRFGFSIKQIDLNFHFTLKRLTDNYLSEIPHNARKNLKKADKSNLIFRECENIDEKIIAYNIIQENRNAKEFPLKMNWNELNKTINIIESDFFLISYFNIYIASAIVFHVSEKIVQVIYWGDIPRYSNLRTMNFLSLKIFEYYQKKGMEVIDIGPSTENSIPNLGLCSFKESIGCDIQPKLSLYLKF